MKLAVSLLVLALFASLARGADPLSSDAIRQRIQAHRTANATLRITAADGKPLVGVEVVLRQTRHKFLFGCNAFGLKPAEDAEPQKLYQQRYAGLLNFATLPFYWGAYERTEGQTNAERVAAMAKWCAEHGIRTKGHPLCWQQVAPRWVQDRDLDEAWKLQLARITREVTGFKGLVDTWDVVNEAVVMPNYAGETTPIPAICRKIGQVELIRQTFAAARAANPNATFLLNDYDTSPKYEKLLRDCLAAGVPIDVIGIQSHMHQGYWGAARAWEVCERFAKFGKPLHFTELTILSGPRKANQRWNGPRYDDWLSTPEEEKRQAEQVAEFYTILFSHPAVHAITWWDFSDSGAWLGAPAGLVRSDMSPKPAYDALMKRIKGEWWTKEVRATTNAAGQVTFRGFLGDYTLESPSGKSTFRLDRPGDAQVDVKLVEKP